jgi:hypothetical protein
MYSSLRFLYESVTNYTFSVSPSFIKLFPEMCLNVCRLTNISLRHGRKLQMSHSISALVTENSVASH